MTNLLHQAVPADSQRLVQQRPQRSPMRGILVSTQPFAEIHKQDEIHAPPPAMFWEVNVGEFKIVLKNLSLVA
ncbi:hypothetical protein AJ78_00910 [Emergomyces pasteurianus Ep9510]|uniref:Uncharacterized protein n=1 Tax=Emergomyces pasteurianus Ep9510 TaxID=1447872 RepID=A0A1J9QTC2_9EURO|nr:hypothetical protein AJ78_00910 [Emergomyces pasteurianus Ep9510]